MVDLIYTTKQGQLLGQIEKDMDGKPFLSFLGIPYAKPPVGELRFKDPQPPELWEGIRDATKESNVCYGAEINKPEEYCSSIPIESEDCLYLNVFTRGKMCLNDKQLKPVMMYIFGGRFITGCGSRIIFGPEYLMTEDIVLVTINYRIGVLGFMKIDDPTLGVTGNGGLKDQVAALKWIQKNIEEFGGNPNNVTIFGHSGGATALHCLILSPLAKNLFHKAILQSCTIFCPLVWGLNNALQLAQNCGFTASNASNREILKFLQEISAEKLIEGQAKFHDSMTHEMKRDIGITIEVEAENSLLFEDPMTLIKSGNYNHVPMMFGYTNLECLIEERNQFSSLLTKKTLVPFHFRVDQKSDDYKETNKKISAFYFDAKKEDQVIAAYKFLSDFTILYSTHLSVTSHVKSCTQPIYYYRMSLETELNFIKRRYKFTIKGVCHGDELGYLFMSWDSPKIKSGSLEDISLRRFVKLWTNFAKTGNPTPVDDVLLGVKWEPVTENKLNFLDIGENLVLGVNPDFERMKFWEEITPETAITNLYK